MRVPEATSREDTSRVRLLHDLAKIHATYDDPDLVPVMALACRAGLLVLAEEPRRARLRAANYHTISGRAVPSCLASAAGCRSRTPRGPRGPREARRPGHRPRWGRSCGGTCCSWARCTGCCWPSWRVWRRCCLAGRRWRSSQSTPSKTGLRPQEQGAAFGYTKIQGKSLLVRGLNVPLAASDAAGSW
jgi:hypothetical protein